MDKQKANMAAAKIFGKTPTIKYGKVWVDGLNGQGCVSKYPFDIFTDAVARDTVAQKLGEEHAIVFACDNLKMWCYGYDGFGYSVICGTYPEALGMACIAVMEVEK